MSKLDNRPLPSLWIDSNGKIADPRAPAGGCGPGFSAGCGPLGGFANGGDLAPHPLSPVARLQHSVLNEHLYALASRKKKSRAALPRPTSSGELNLVGVFISMWKEASDLDILQAIDLNGEGRGDVWYPGTPEFRRMGESLGNSIVFVRNTEQVLNAIVKNRPQRVNIFTHGTPGFIMLQGKTTYGTDEKGRFRLGSGEVDSLNDPGFCAEEILQLSREGTIPLRTVRDAFQTDNPTIYVYACQAGTVGADGHSKLLGGIADALEVDVFGFVHSILYHPQTNRQKSGKVWPANTKITGWKWSYPQPDPQVSDYKKLIPDTRAIGRRTRTRGCQVRDWWTP